MEVRTFKSACFKTCFKKIGGCVSVRVGDDVKVKVGRGRLKNREWKGRTE